jgi:hypothetical protein
MINMCKKFGVVQVTSVPLDIGIKLKGTGPSERFGTSSGWNDMDAHAVRIENPEEIDKELLKSLNQACEKAV